MKRIFWMTVLLLVVSVATAPAQSRGSYFFENSLLRSKLNPAFAPKNDYASFFGAGSFSVDMAGNVGLKNFLYPDGDVNHLFLSDAVPAEKFLSDLPAADPYLRKRVESDLCGFGMKMGRDGYATLSLSVVDDGSYVLPGDLLRYAKAGSGAAQGPFEGGSAELAGYAALAAGYSHDLSSIAEGLRAGVRVKLLLGLAAGSFAFERIGMQFSPDQVSAVVRGTGATSGIGYTPDNGISISRPGLHSMGAAFDFGASYRIPMDGPWTLSGIELSASVCDLGGLRYSHGVSSLSLDHQFEFSGIDDISGDLKAGFEKAVEDLMAFSHVDASNGEPFVHWLSPSIHAGASAHLWQDKANAGLLYYHSVGHSNLMAAGGFSPFEWLNLGFSWTFLGPANRFGFYAEFIPRKYVGVFFGTERASLSANSSHIPVRNFTESMALGLNILFN